MHNIQLKINENNKGVFFLEEDGERLAEMDFTIAGDKMVISHTEVSDKLAGQGIGKELVATMTEYVRSHELKVIPLCPYVHALFKRHPEDYADIWNR